MVLETFPHKLSALKQAKQEHEKTQWRQGATAALLSCVLFKSSMK